MRKIILILIIIVFIIHNYPNWRENYVKRFDLVMCISRNDCGEIGFYKKKNKIIILYLEAQTQIYNKCIYDKYKSDKTIEYNQFEEVLQYINKIIGTNYTAESIITNFENNKEIVKSRGKITEEDFKKILNFIESI